MYRYAQSALSAAGLQLRGKGAPPQRQEGMRCADSGRSRAPLGMYETVLRSVMVGQKATQEIAHGLVLLARGVFSQTQLVGGLVTPAPHHQFCHLGHPSGAGMRMFLKHPSPT